MPDRLVPFLLVVAVLTITPGPDMALVLRNGVRGGSATAWRTGIGCCVGIAVHAALALVGLSAILVASATAFTIVKVAGAAYLVYLGAKALLHSFPSSKEADTDMSVEPTAPASQRQAFRQGLMSNLLNPKIALLFLTLIPQFVAPGEPKLATTTALAGVFLATAVVWWRVFSLGIGLFGRLLSRESVGRTLDRVTGTVLIGLGLRVALTD
jgi:threonine/homoserine/homoserine lactone efflux protein